METQIDKKVQSFIDSIALNTRNGEKISKKLLFAQWYLDGKILFNVKNRGKLALRYSQKGPSRR